VEMELQIQSGKEKKKGKMKKLELVKLQEFNQEVG